ncbi:glycoside hydrolase family 31 protein [Butyrivibrio sp. AC2005]|uniref:glycoside hydrolase family 31 protein n=1 Tax=Butyrivibrio sp. AC2005 TaxID=1280672 RepID=UPI000402147F|nr:TIM-barrel domain-containing protein [Butyrivibrio sp. AC2005]
MMDVIPDKDRSISKVYENNGVVFMESEAGTLRVIPQKGGIVRVSFSNDGVFCKEQGEDFADYTGSIEYTLAERAAFDNTKTINCENGTSNTDNCMGYVRIITHEGEVRIDKTVGAISFYNTAGELLLSERISHPRELEKISLYRMVNADNAQIEEIVTADGVKKKVKAADREEYGTAYKTRTYFEFDDEEILTGFGQGENGEWNLRNSTYYVHQANRKIAMPMMISSRNYGLLFSTESLIMFSETADKAYIQTEADYYLDYYFLFGNDPFDVVKNYRRLTGKAAMLPLWTCGYIQSKERYKSQAEILETADEFRKRDIGLDCIVLDWMSWEDGKWGQKSFDRVRFPDPKAMTDKLHESGIHFMMSIWPNMSEGTENNREFKERGLLLPGMSIYNAFSKEARDLYWSQVERSLWQGGVDAWWCDSSEPITPEWEHSIEPADSEKYFEFRENASNIMPLEKANAFSKYHAQTIWDGQRNSSKAKRVVNLTRSGWAGSQKYGTILWSGDISASWDTLAKQVRVGLQLAASGMPYWTLDTGAFFVKKGIQWYWDGDYSKGIDNAYKKLYVRWLEYAAFLPVFRAHGTDVEREPWAFGERGDKYYEAICETIRNRYKLIPYIYSLGAFVHLEDGMIMRPLMFDFNNDEKAVGISDQFMLGDSLMVCPIVEESGVKDKCGEENFAESDIDTRNIYLPKGAGWYEFTLGELIEDDMNRLNPAIKNYTEESGSASFHKYYEGGQTIRYQCPINRIPVFVKAGSIIPTKKPQGCTDAMKGENIEVLIYPGADAEFRLYEDAGDGYGYENGEYCITELSWNEEAKSYSYSSSGDLRFREGELKFRFPVTYS